MWLIVIKGQKKYQLNENIICQRTFPPMIKRERENMLQNFYPVHWEKEMRPDKVRYYMLVCYRWSCLFLGDI